MTAPSLTGRCTCGQVRYRLTRKPLFVHCCHCTWCQRESGAAFVLNAMIETECLAVEGELILVHTLSASGKGQEVARCPSCHVALWSHYAGGGRSVAFVRVGTLDDPAACPPDIHIFTSTKQPWLDLGGTIPVMPDYYDRTQHWPEESLSRLATLLARQRAAKPQ